MLEQTILDLIAVALQEDVGPGDVTANYFTPENATSTAKIIARKPGYVAGTEVATEVFLRVDPELQVETVITDGKPCESGDTILTITGKTRPLLTAERTALNFLGRLCGIATLTNRYVEAVSGTGARILDTRKTTPGWRLLEKEAVRAGGGTNHRIGLFDQVMVKDNHLLAEQDLGALQKSIDAVKKMHPDMVIELEADTIEQVKLFVDNLTDVDVILLDNMTPKQLREAVSFNGSRVILEASGGVTLDTVRTIAETGVDTISVGALTHSAKALDISLTLT